jgi:hypothetical protein
MMGERYLVDMKKKIVHDLDHETEKCQIDLIIGSGDDKAYLSILEAILKDQNRAHDCTGEFAKMSA